MFRKFLAVVLPLIVILFLLEAGLRVSGRYLTYTERIQGEYITHYDQNYDTWYRTWGNVDSFTLDHGEFRYLYQLNQYGIREREFPEYDSSGIRLFVLGDSFTEGVGAPYDEAWPRKLEELMMEDGYDVSVYNLGMSGNDPFYNHVLLRDKFLKYHPTHVIFAVNDSDFDDYIMRGGFERFQSDGTVQGKSSPWFHEMYIKSHVVRLFVHISGYDRALVRKRLRSSNETDAFHAMTASLDSTYNMLRTNDIHFLVVAHDNPGELCNPKRKNRMDKFEGSQNEFPLVVLGPPLQQDVDMEHCFDLGWPIDGHYNSKGYGVLGTAVYREIKELYPGFLRSE